MAAKPHQTRRLRAGVEPGIAQELHWRIQAPSEKKSVREKRPARRTSPVRRLPARLAAPVRLSVSSASTLYGTLTRPCYHSSRPCTGPQQCRRALLPALFASTMRPCPVRPWTVFRLPSQAPAATLTLLVCRASAVGNCAPRRSIS
jgi:hypothetical protein